MFDLSEKGRGIFAQAEYFDIGRRAVGAETVDVLGADFEYQMKQSTSDVGFRGLPIGLSDAIEAKVSDPVGQGWRNIKNRIKRITGEEFLREVRQKLL